MGSVLGSPLERGPAARFPVDFQPADNDQAYRIAARDGNGGGHDHSRRFTSRGTKRPGANSAPALRCHGVSFDDGLQLRGSAAESDDETLGGAAPLDRDKVTADDAVTDL